VSRLRVWPLGIGSLTTLAIGAILAINLAGLGGMALARRGALDEAERILNLETASRARSLESRLAECRADLAYLAGSPILFGLESALVSRDPARARWRRLEAEGSLLLFLRGHAEVARLQVRSGGGNPLLIAARRGGVPVLWMTPDVAASAPIPAREVDTPERPLTAHFEFREGERSVTGAVILDATLDAANLLPAEGQAANSSSHCALRDGTGQVLARTGAGHAAEESAQRSAGLSARAPVTAEGWPSPAWELTCERDTKAVLARVEPLAGRYRLSLLLNAGVMSLTLLLGAFAIHQTRRRAGLEASSREEARVRELERQLFHAERLSTAGRLAAGIAHEINNPLEGMSNYLGLARQDLARGDAGSASKRLDGVREGLHRAEEIVRRVLAHSEPSTAPHAPVDLGEILRQSLGFVRERKEFETIRFAMELPEQRLMVQGNAAQLGQVFLNLLLNACEAQPGGGEVRVTARREGKKAIVEIADRGPGVNPSDAGKVFEPFYTTKNSTGLGLSICYAIARRHDAELKLEDRPGGGAVFKMIFNTRE
jgi:signal transduction histidine kinase